MPKENWEVSEGRPPTRSVAVAVIQSVTITPAPLMSSSIEAVLPTIVTSWYPSSSWPWAKRLLLVTASELLKY